MSAHDPKASMIGATSVSTPMVRNPNERRVNIAAAGLAQIEAIMATGKGFEEAYAEAWRREVKPRQASVLMLEAPAPRRDPRPARPSPSRVKTMADREAEDAQMRADIISHVKRTGIETSASQLIKGYKAAPNLVYAALSHLVRAGVLVKREANTRTFYGLAGGGTKAHVHRSGGGRTGMHPCAIDGIRFEAVADAMQHFSKCRAIIRRWAKTGVSEAENRTSHRGIPCIIDGIKFDNHTAAAAHFNVSCQTAGKYVKRGTSAPAKSDRLSRERGKCSVKPCTIDGVKYPSRLAAGIALNVGKGIIKRWADNGKSDAILPHYAKRPKEGGQEAARQHGKHKTYTIDGIFFENHTAAMEHFGASRRTIDRWGDAGKSTPVRQMRLATASQAFDQARTRKNIQTPSSGAISQSGAQIGGL